VGAVDADDVVITVAEQDARDVGVFEPTADNQDALGLGESLGVDGRAGDAVFGQKPLGGVLGAPRHGTGPGPRSSRRPGRRGGHPSAPGPADLTLCDVGEQLDGRHVKRGGELEQHVQLDTLPALLQVASSGLPLREAASTFEPAKSSPPITSKASVNP
jgi:hypothetical protein